MTDYTPGSARVPTQTLGQDDFLKLVVAQMSSQDPLNPQSDTEFVSQMAQFSALQENTTMEQDISNLRSQQQLAQANALLGRAVTVQDPSSGMQIKGTVSNVNISQGTPTIVVGSKDYSLDSLLSIAPATT